MKWQAGFKRAAHLESSPCMGVGGFHSSVTDISSLLFISRFIHLLAAVLSLLLRHSTFSSNLVAVQV